MALPLAKLTRPSDSPTRVATILVGIRLEERDLVGSYGDAYRQYRSKVRMLLPFPRRTSGDDNTRDSSTGSLAG
jgi:hypothetical protein